VDDKWLFTPRYFRELAERHGFAECELIPLHQPQRAFEIQTETNLKLGVGRGRDALPEWAWQTIRRYDEWFSEDLKAELMLEACVLLRR
jgi:hypothetical protein